MFSLNILRETFFWIASIFSYYKLFKGFIFYLSRRLVNLKIFLSLQKKYTSQELTGVLELGLVANSHILFAFLLIYFLGLDVNKLGLFHLQFSHIFYGCLLGIGEMSLSSLFCLVFIKITEQASQLNESQTQSRKNQWQTIARGGWIRHHIQSFELLPFFASLTILFFQVGSEELVFRGIIINSLIQNGCNPFLSICFSIFLFVSMQAFHMPGYKSALFPMIGALVMGIIHSLLYYFVPALPPLIIAHVVFFLMTVI